MYLNVVLANSGDKRYPTSSWDFLQRAVKFFPENTKYVISNPQKFKG